MAWMRRATLARRLEVGRVQGASFAWQRAHFGAWCVVSAPLVLGVDLTDTANLAAEIKPNKQLIISQIVQAMQLTGISPQILPQILKTLGLPDIASD